MRRRSWLPAIVGALLLGALVAAFFSERRIEGEVPGGSVVSLAWSGGRFLVITDSGAFWGDGSRWERAGISPMPRVGASYKGGAVIVDRSRVGRVDGEKLREIGRVPSGLTPTAVAVDDSGSVYLAGHRQRRSELYVDGVLVRTDGEVRPTDILAIGISGAGRVVVGGLRTGVMELHSDSWRRLLATPTRTLAFDPEDDAHLLLGTSGGVLESRDEGMSWTFTEMRLGIEAMAASEDAFHVVTADRLLYSSPNGSTGWELKRGP